jgi:hypothetical protein
MVGHSGPLLSMHKNLHPANIHLLHHMKCAPERNERENAGEIYGDEYKALVTTLASS